MAGSTLRNNFYWWNCAENQENKWTLLLLLLLSLFSPVRLCATSVGSPPGSPVPGILQARTLEWVAISFSNAWKWKVKVKSLSRVGLLATRWTAAYQAPSIHGVFQARVLEWCATAISEVNVRYTQRCQFIQIPFPLETNLMSKNVSINGYMSNIFSPAKANNFP